MTAPTIVWFRRDLRLSDHPALTAAAERGGAVIPIFILDPETEALGAAHRWRLSLSLADLSRRLTAMGSRLILRRGPALEVLRRLTAETGAGAIHWSRLFDAAAKARDSAVKLAFRDGPVAAKSFPGHVLFDPWTVQTGAGGYYRVYSPFWRAVDGRDVAGALPTPALPAPDTWPASEALDDWRLGADMRRGAAVVAQHVLVGEDAARDRLDTFLHTRADAYKRNRDRPDLPATSGLSENLTYGEISAAEIWRKADLVRRHDGGAGVEHFLKELVWRDFAYHLLHHAPHMETRNWREGWADFPWSEDAEAARPWFRGMTGVQMVDAAMRELYVTGTMHNRSRMLVASFLTKHMLIHWKIGQAWFADTLIDWDPASNAMGWQWVAGCGPDAAPYFRIFNPDTQAEKFDPAGGYRRKFIAELGGGPVADSYFDATPVSWGLDRSARYPAPVVDLKQGRARALAAYEQLRTAA